MFTVISIFFISYPHPIWSKPKKNLVWFASFQLPKVSTIVSSVALQNVCAQVQHFARKSGLLDESLHVGDCSKHRWCSHHQVMLLAVRCHDSFKPLIEDYESQNNPYLYRSSHRSLPVRPRDGHGRACRTTAKTELSGNARRYEGTAGDSQTFKIILWTIFPQGHPTYMVVEWAHLSFSIDRSKLKTSILLPLQLLWHHSILSCYL